MERRGRDSMSISGIALIRGAAMAVALVGIPAARAQSPYAVLVGLVRDSAGHPIPGVEVVLQGAAPAYTRTNDSGGFRLPGLPPGETSVTARRLGFAPATVSMKLRSGRTDSLVLSLTTVVASLQGMLIEEDYDARSHRILAGFW